MLQPIELDVDGKRLDQENSSAGCTLEMINQSLLP